MPTENSFLHGFRRAYERDRKRERQGERGPVTRVIVGSLLAIWGLALLLDNLGLGEVRQYAHRAWPAVLVIVGITLLIHRDPTRNRHGFWGTVLMVAGVCTFVSQQAWIHVRFWGLLGPVLVVLLGASFVYRALRGAKGRGH